MSWPVEAIGAFVSTVRFRLFNFNSTRGQSDNRKRLITRKTDEKDEGKHRFNLQISLGCYEENIIWH